MLNDGFLLASKRTVTKETEGFIDIHKIIFLKLVAYDDIGYRRVV